MSVTLHPLAFSPLMSALRRRWRAQPAVASEIDVLSGVTLQVRADGLPEELDSCIEQFRVGDAPYVVLAEDGRLEHKWLVYLSLCSGLMSFVAARGTISIHKFTRRDVGRVL